MKQFLTTIASVPLIGAAGAAVGDPGYAGGYNHMMWGGGFGGGLTMLVFWAAVIALIVFGVRWMSDGGHRPGGGRRSDAIDVLRDRFARGEIDEEEFKRRKAALEA